MIKQPQPEGGNALALLMAAAAASMQCQQQAVQKQLNQNHHKQQLQQHLQLNNNHHQKQQYKNRKTSPTSATRQVIASESNFINKIVTKQANNNNINSIKRVSNNVNNNSTNINNNNQQHNINNQLKDPQPADDSDHVELRTLETWYDEDGKPIDDDSCQELADIISTDGWSADEMFKFNEKMHKVTSTFNEKTLGENYTTPLPKSSSKTAIRMATQLAKEIEKKISDEGRKTPESSDDDELFEAKRKQKKLQTAKMLNQLQIDQAHNNPLHQLQKQQQQKHLNQLKEKKTDQRQPNQTRLTDLQVNLINNLIGQKNTTKLLSQQLSNNSQCSMNGTHNYHQQQSPSTSPTLKHTIIRPVSSSSRNILRSCLA